MLGKKSNYVKARFRRQSIHGSRAKSGTVLVAIEIFQGQSTIGVPLRTYRAFHSGFGISSCGPGELSVTQPIVDREIFEQVQQLLKANSLGRTGRRQQNNALLVGLVFDDRGNRMSPSFTVKRGVRYSFYVSSTILKGRKV